MGLVLARVGVVVGGLPHERDDAPVPEPGQVLHGCVRHLDEVGIDTRRPNGTTRGSDEDGGDLLIQEHRFPLITLSHVHEDNTAQGARAHERAQLDQRCRGGHDRDDDLDPTGFQGPAHSVDVVEVVGVNGRALPSEQHPCGAQPRRGQ